MADVSTWSFGYLECFVTTRNTPVTKWKPGLKDLTKLEVIIIVNVSNIDCCPKVLHCSCCSKYIL